jgi:hypothetical protein
MHGGIPRHRLPRRTHQPPPRFSRRPRRLGDHGHAQERQVRGEEAILATAELLNPTLVHVQAAVRYYDAFTDEIDQRIALCAEDADEAEAAWREN